nr:hypothetical protein [Tanacetum cinerariifolium]
SHSSQAQGSSSYADELMFLFFANQSSSPQLDNKDLEEINQGDLEEMGLKWQERLGTYDWSYQLEEETTDFALMAFTSNPSSSSSSNSMVKSCSRQCVQSYEQLKKLFDEQRKNLRKANLEIVGYDSRFNESKVLDVKKEEVTETMFDNRSSDEENSLANDRFKKGEGSIQFPLLSLGTICLPNLTYHLLD